MINKFRPYVFGYYLKKIPPLTGGIFIDYECGKLCLYHTYVVFNPFSNAILCFQPRL
jgi:hypothetical protein